MVTNDLRRLWKVARWPPMLPMPASAKSPSNTRGWGNFSNSRSRISRPRIQARSGSISHGGIIACCARLVLATLARTRMRGGVEPSSTSSIRSCMISPRRRPVPYATR